MSEEVKYDPEMRGALYEEANTGGNDKHPVATGKLTISGVELRIAMWSSRVTKGDAKKKYWPIKVEYRQGATRFLVPVEPKNVVASGSGAIAASASSGDGKSDSSSDAYVSVDDLPY